jgi:hypothetical protein
MQKTHCTEPDQPPQFQKHNNALNETEPATPQAAASSRGSAASAASSPMSSPARPSQIHGLFVPRSQLALGLAGSSCAPHSAVHLQSPARQRPAHGQSRCGLSQAPPHSLCLSSFSLDLSPGAGKSQKDRPHTHRPCFERAHAPQCWSQNPPVPLPFSPNPST